MRQGTTGISHGITRFCGVSRVATSPLSEAREVDLGEVRVSVVVVRADSVRLRLATPNEDVQLDLTFRAQHIAQLMLLMTQQRRA